MMNRNNNTLTIEESIDSLGYWILGDKGKEGGTIDRVYAIEEKDRTFTLYRFLWAGKTPTFPKADKIYKNIQNREDAKKLLLSEIRCSANRLGWSSTTIIDKTKQ